MYEVKILINAPVELVWKYFTEAKHIKNWYYASEDWHTPKAENNLIVGGEFCFTMAAKDGSMSFDFIGIYTEIELHKTIKYTLGDNRKVIVNLQKIEENKILLTEFFDPENENPKELQQKGWQAILDNFKKYIEKK